MGMGQLKLGEQNKGPFINVNGLKGKKAFKGCPWALGLTPNSSPHPCYGQTQWADLITNLGLVYQPKPKSKANRGGLKNPSQTQAQNFIFLQLVPTRAWLQHDHHLPAAAAATPASTSQHQHQPAPALASSQHQH